MLAWEYKQSRVGLITWLISRLPETRTELKIACYFRNKVFLLDPLSHPSSSLGINYFDNKIFNASPIISEISNIIKKQIISSLLLVVMLEMNRKQIFRQRQRFWAYRGVAFEWKYTGYLDCYKTDWFHNRHWFTMPRRGVKGGVLMAPGIFKFHLGFWNL